MKEQVGAYVGDLLKPRFKSNAITKEDYKWIVRKTVDKVLSYHVIRNSLLIKRQHTVLTPKHTHACIDCVV